MVIHLAEERRHGKEVSAGFKGKCSACMLGWQKGSRIKLHYGQGWVHKRCWHSMVDDNMTPRAIRDRITKERLRDRQIERDKRKLGHVNPVTGLPEGVVPPASKKTSIDEIF